MAILTVAQYRTMSQTPGSPPTDEDIQLALDRYEGLIEGYTGRSFDQLTRCEQFFSAGPGPLQLSVYPIAEVLGLTVDGEDADPYSYPVHKATGMIAHGGALYGKHLVVSYTAGLYPAPHEVQTTLATLVEAYLAGGYGGTNELSGAAKETVMGVASIDYGSGGQSFSEYGTPYPELGPYTAVLEKYRDSGLMF